MNWILDLIVVAIVVLCAVLSARRGFVKTILSVASLILCVFIVSSFGNPLSEVIYDSCIEKPISSSIEKSIAENFGSSADINYDADDLLDTIPSSLRKQLDKYGFDEDKLHTVVSLKQNPAETAKAISADIVKPLVTPMLLIIVDIVLFTVSAVILRIVTKFICKLFKAPVLNKVNKLFGVVLGIVKGLVISAIVCTVITYIVTNKISGDFLIFTEKAIADSVLFAKLSMF